MATVNTTPAPAANPEPELHLLLPKDTLDQGLLTSLFQNLDDFFFPKKLPPLHLTSKPIPVRDIWGFYNYKKNGVLSSTVLHIVALAIIIVTTLVLTFGLYEYVIKRVTLLRLLFGLKSLPR